MIDFHNRTSRKADFAGDYTSKAKVVPLSEANIICSDHPTEDDTHRVVIDLDVPAYLLPSSTPGHSHLYIDVPISTDLLESLLITLADCGIVERGYADASIDRGYSAVRLPWVRKDLPVEEDPEEPPVGFWGLPVEELVEARPANDALGPM